MCIGLKHKSCKIKTEMVWITVKFWDRIKRGHFKVGFSDQIKGGILKCQTVSAKRNLSKTEFYWYGISQPLVAVVSVVKNRQHLKPDVVSVRNLCAMIVFFFSNKQ